MDHDEKSLETAHRSTELERILDRVTNAIRGLQFGSVEIVIHDSKVVQIERKEKFRLDKPERR